MQNDLISRSALIAHIGDLGSDPEDDTTFLTMGQACAIAHKHIVDMVKAAPAVDAVEVVRCKDCAKCDHVKETPVDGGVWICHLLRMLVYENHFCSYGKRRADDGI